MARTGRPPIPEDERLDERVDVRMKSAEKLLIEEAAGEENVSTWARQRLLQAARRDLRRRQRTQ
ncbi:MULTISPECIES: hypothetical protein [Mycolicibacterium]|uniref:hypothetical protein n=1 Tax=Mycolicibacterium TaxID=1866885 RepID=UPI001CDBE9D1|nr:hypothetical protein [Mycolicibacterium fortuitum]UBV20365.1 hypothetical protein H8Z59_24305 [Mycolicibacterium fortuitum]